MKRNEESSVGCIRTEFSGCENAKYIERDQAVPYCGLLL